MPAHRKTKQNREMRDLRQAGWTWPRIAKQYGITPQAAAQAVRRQTRRDSA